MRYIRTTLSGIFVLIKYLRTHVINIYSPDKIPIYQYKVIKNKRA